MFRQKILFIVPILLPLAVCSDSRVQGSQELLAEADRFAMLYNWSAAAPLYAQAESLFKESGDQKNALLARLGYFWTTADTGVRPQILHEVAMQLRDPFVQGDSHLLLRALVTKAFLDRNANETAARESWEQILKLATTLGDKRWEERAKAEIGQIVYMDGDVKLATGMVREAIISLYLHLDLGAAIYYTAMVGNGFVEAGRPETALEYCDTALRMSVVAKGSGFPFLAYQGKARALIALNRNAEGEGVLQEALGQARKEHNDVALTQLLVVAGTAAASDDPTKAIGFLREATEISQEKGFHHVFAWSTFELATVYREAGDLDGADLLASKTIEIMRELEDRYHLPQHLALLADLKAKEGDFQRADQLYSEAADVIDALLVNVNTRQLKSSLIATLSDAYVGHFELAATKFSDPRKAYEIIESARGRSVADTLRGDSETMSFADEISTGAQKDINRLQLALLNETDRTARQSLLDELFVAEQLLSPVRRIRSPLAFAADRPKPVPLPILQASLSPDEVVLEYVLGETQSYCLRITRSGVAVLVLPGSRRRIEDLVGNYLAAVQSKQPEMKIGKELFSVVLEPVIGRGSKARLIIIPDGKLHLLPFDGLRNTEGEYVLQSHVITYAPSATVLHLLRKPRSADHAAVNLLGVGGVVYSGPGVFTAKTGRAGPHESVAPDVFDLDAGRFPNLPGSEQEVTTVAGIIKGSEQVLLGNNATEVAFKALPLADFRIIHLAVHGVASTRFPDRAALVLASSSDSGEDGLLQAREIRDLSLSADLVTLSACETGNGKLLGEEGIASLENAFLLAGAKAVIASRWTADDTYTVALMKRLYEHLIDGDDKGAALRRAKMDLLEKFGDEALPVYWAGFKLVGDGLTAIFK